MTGEGWFQKVSAGESRETIALAETLATAARVEAELIRHVRLTLHPGLDAGLESDLWFSGMIQSRAYDGIVFDPRAADFLRRQLQARNAGLYHAAWREVSAFHKDLPPALRIEEEMLYLSALPAGTGLEKIRDYLRSSLAALVAGEREGLATWVLRALPRMPVEIRTLEEARMLEAAAQIRLTGEAGAFESHPEWQWLVNSAPRDTTAFGVRLFPGIVEIGPEDRDRAVRMEVTNLEPISLRIAWSGGETSLSMAKGGTRRIRVGAGPVRIFASTGETFEIASDESSDALDFAELLQSYVEFHGFSTIEKLDEADIGIGGELRVIAGPPGSGKTAVLNYLARLRKPADPVVHHFFSRVSWRYRDPDIAIRSLCSQIERIAPETAVPETLTGSDRLEYLLANGAFPSTLIVVLDDLDAADGGPGNRLFRLLERPLAGKVSILATCTKDGEIHRWLQKRGAVRWYLVEEWPEVLQEAVLKILSNGVESRLRQRFLRIAGNSPLSATLLARYKFWPEEIEEDEPMMMVWQAIWRWTATEQPDYMRALAIIAAMQEPVPEAWVAEAAGRSSGKLWPEFFDRTAALLERHVRADGTNTYRPFHEQVRRFILERFLSETPNPHLRIAQTIARWPRRGESDGYQQEYALRYGLYHASESEDPYRAFRLSTDVSYLQERLTISGPLRIAAEVRDLSFGGAAWSASKTSGPVDAYASVAQSVANALEWFADHLNRDPSLLASILYSQVRQATDGDRVYGDVRFPPQIPGLRLARPMREGPRIVSESSNVSSPRLNLKPIRTGHKGAVLGCLVTDGSSPSLVSWSADHTVCIRDLASLELEAVGTHHRAEVTACVQLTSGGVFASTAADGCVAVFDRQGLIACGFHECDALGVQALHSTGDAPPRLITWSADRTLGVWTSESGELRRDGVLRGHLDEVLCCDTGRFAASGSADGTVRLWDLNSFNEVARLEGQGSVTAVRISPPGYEGLMVVVFGSQNGSVGFWEVGWTERSDGTYEVLPGRVQTMTGHTMGVLDCQADFDRNLALSASLDHTLRLWDSLTGTELRKFEGHQAAVLKCGFLKDNVAISTSADSTVRTWDLGSGQPLATMNEHSAPVRGCIAVGNDQVVSCSDDRSMMLWTTPPHGPQQKGQARTRRQAPVRIDGMHRPARICFTDRSKSQFLTASSHRGFEVYDLKDDHHFRKIDGLVRGAVSSERLRMAFVWTDRAAYVWQFDMTVGGNIQEIPRELAQGIRAASFIHGRRLAVAYAHTHEIAVMDTFGPVLTTLGGHQEAVTALASDDEGRLLVSVSRDRSFRVWNGETLQGTAVFGGYPRALEGCVLAPDGSRLVSYIADRTLHTSERSGDSFTPGPVLRGHRDAITCAAMTPYNETIVSGSRDGTIRVWDAKSGREIQVLEGHRDWITALSISADGDTLLTSAEDDTLKLWDIASGRCLETFVGTCPFVSISIADRAVCAGDQAGRVWMLEWGEVKKTQLTSSSKIVLLTTMRDRPMAREVVASLKNFRGLGGQTEPLVLDLDDARESLTQAGEVGEADLVLVLATEAAAAHQNAPALDLAFRRASGGQLVVPLLEKPENWGNSELMRFQGVPWKSDDAHRNEKLTAHLQVHVAGVSL